MDNFKELERLARALDPDQTERGEILNKAVGYTERFLNELAIRPGFSKGNFGKLEQTRIEEAGKKMEDIIDILQTEVDPAGISSASGKHLGFIPGGGLWASAVADMLGDIANKYSGIAFSGPGAVKIETQVINWMTDLIGYPGKAFGNLTSGGSIANLIAIKAARDFHGINSTSVRNSVIYFGAQTHHSVHKALHTTGLHEAVLREIAVDENFRLDVGLLKKQLEDDKQAGLTPLLVIGSAGTTDTGAIDLLDQLADLSKTYNTWFHVDAAYGGFFLLLDEVKAKLKGIERSDSIVLDPHKTLFLPFGSGAVLLKDRKQLLASNASKASYLVDTEDASGINPSDTGIELTRPNRGLRIWLPLQLHGVTAFKNCLREKIALSDYFYSEIQKQGFETGPYPDLTVTIFRYPEEGNAINQRLIDAIHDDGRVFLSSTIIQGKLWLRCAIVSHRTHLKEVEECLVMITENLKKVLTATFE
jgi:glutamate/tyrosine decarboxylase-like PLP-dependent enzyme